MTKEKFAVNHSKSNLFLLEIIIVILFLSVTAAICMKTFASSRMMIETAEKKDHSSEIATTIAEEFKSSENKDLLQNRYYDSNFVQTQVKEIAVYKAETKIQDYKDYQKLTISIKEIKTGKDVFSLQVGKLKGDNKND